MNSKIPALIFAATLAFCFGVLAAASFAEAADLGTGEVSGNVEATLEPVGSASFWNGVYSGLQTDYKWQSVGVMGNSNVEGVDGAGIGGFLGFNQQLGNAIVGGVEMQGGYSGSQNTIGSLTASQDWETNLRARMGYAFEQNLIYGLAGIGASRVTVTDGVNSDSNWLTGWSVGAGFERSFTQSIFGRVEYDYSRYRGETFNLGASTPNVGLNGHEVKLGVGVKF